MKKTLSGLSLSFPTPYRKPSRHVLVVLVLILSASVAYGGMVIKEKNIMNGDPSSTAKLNEKTKTREAVTYIQGKKVRIETEKKIIVIDFEKGRFLTLDPSKKTYTDLTLEHVKAAQERTLKWLANLRKDMEKKLMALPPDKQDALRKKMEAMPSLDLGDVNKEIAFEVKPTGKREEINGFACEAYEIYENGKKSTIYWVTKSVPVGPFDTYQQEKRKWLEGSNPAMLYRLDEWEHIRDKGFPVKVIRIKPVMGKVTFTQEVVEVEDKNLPESLFQPPADFKADKRPSLPNPVPPEKKPPTSTSSPGKT